ncbi:MAG: sigma-70 family RNA polymerase sigma factor [Caldilineaceae bacterium]|nr:sigma-70 family RNA polymerase sigma factor [Caldilineaceae bacterium]
MQIDPTSYAQATDELLLKQVALQDTAAYEALYDRHTQAVYSLIVRIVRQPTRAEELLQETFWQVWRNAAAYRGEGAALAWLMRIARNRALDELRRQKARPQTVEQRTEGMTPAEAVDYAAARTAPLEDVVETTVTRRWNQQQVQLALAEIPAEQRICLELNYFEGLSQREIAEHLALPLGTIKSRMRIGMEKLEYQLRSIGFP